MWGALALTRLTFHSKSNILRGQIIFWTAERAIEGSYCRGKVVATSSTDALTKMGRELQKKKNRSGINKVRMKPKSKKAHLVKHPIIAANWDKSQTLSQNYKRLGLTARLDKSTGGVERKLSDIDRLRGEGSGARYEKGDDPLSIVGTKRAETLNITEAKIERDPVTGKILRVIDSSTARPNPLNDPLNDLDTDSEDDSNENEYEEFHGFNEHASNVEGRRSAKPSGVESDVVKQLELEASRPVAKFKPRQSDGERAFIEELVAKYGDDVHAMAMDMKINYMQRSEGDLKKRIKRWKEAGGSIE